MATTKNKIIIGLLFVFMMFAWVGTSYADIIIKVTVYGKGGVGGDGGGATLCPEQSSSVCAKIEVTIPTKEKGPTPDGGFSIDPNVIIQLTGQQSPIRATLIHADVKEVNFENGTGIFENVIIR